jgi:hypothetical protein
MWAVWMTRNVCVHERELPSGLTRVIPVAVIRWVRVSFSVDVPDMSEWVRSGRWRYSRAPEDWLLLLSTRPKLDDASCNYFRLGCLPKRWCLIRESLHIWRTRAGFSLFAVGAGTNYHSLTNKDTGGRDSGLGIVSGKIVSTPFRDNTSAWVLNTEFGTHF